MRVGGGGLKTQDETILSRSCTEKWSRETESLVRKVESRRFLALFLFESSDGCIQLLGKVWRRDRLAGVSWRGHNRRERKTGSKVQVVAWLWRKTMVMRRGAEAAGGLGQAGWLGNFISRGSLWKASLHISAALPVSNPFESRV